MNELEAYRQALFDLAADHGCESVQHASGGVKVDTKGASKADCATAVAIIKKIRQLTGRADLLTARDGSGFMRWQSLRLKLCGEGAPWQEAPLNAGTHARWKYWLPREEDLEREVDQLLAVQEGYSPDRLLLAVEMEVVVDQANITDLPRLEDTDLGNVYVDSIVARGRTIKLDGNAQCELPSILTCAVFTICKCY